MMICRNASKNTSAIIESNPLKISSIFVSILLPVTSPDNELLSVGVL